MSTLNQYTITAYTEDRVGIVNRVAIIFTRRHINIESMMATETEIPGVYKLSFVVRGERAQLEKVVKFIERHVEIHRAFLHDENQVVYRELGVYKVSIKGLQNKNLEQLLRTYHARILDITPDYFIIEKTGHEAELMDLLHQLEDFGVIEFGRSGRVTVLKWSRRFHQHLLNLATEPEEVWH
jgi:acetolactate synthase I/III small subunit